MGLNPFKDSNLNDLEFNITNFLKDHFQNILDGIKSLWKRFVKKGQERITLMFIPHSEKKIINFHISIFTLTFLLGILITTITITSMLIIDHTSTRKEVSILKKHGINSKIQQEKYIDEIKKLKAYNKLLRTRTNQLHKAAFGKDIDFKTLWAKGGASKKSSESNLLPEEYYVAEDVEEINKELELLKKEIIKINKFLKYRKKIIENTPSIWPTNGYIISRFGKRISPDNFVLENHRGIDIAAFPGAQIRATAPGKIQDIKWDQILGLTITIKHKYGFVTSYSHCQRASVEKNQKVSKGEVIGYVGRTGKTTKYICFYQIKIGTGYEDPLPYLNRISKEAKQVQIEEDKTISNFKPANHPVYN